MKTILLRASLVLTALAVLLSPVFGAAETKIINVRHWAAPDHTRIVIDTTEEPVYTVEKEGNKLSLEVTEAVYTKSLSRNFPLKKPGIDRIVVTPRPEQTVTIELFLTEHTETKVFKLQQFEDRPYRIVVDIALPEIERRESEKRERVKAALKKKIIVIDPGHGGDDPGAVGQLKTYEKNVVLSISRRLRDILNKKEGYRAFLTRNGDYYVPFKKRLKIAREYQADLFISIHADAEKSHQAAGSSVYSLALRSASSEAARILARKENLADIVGGVANGESTKEESDPIILNMLQTSTMNSSKTFGSLLLRNIGSVNRVKFASVQEAPFMVLKLPEIPSVLIETAFISNRQDERLLRSPKFQKEMAEVIAESAIEFLAQGSDPAVPVMTSKKEETQAPEGEKVQEQKAHAKDKDSATAPPAPAAKRPMTVVYTVKKGDSLERIARKYGVTVAAIAELNDVQLKKPLYVNRKLKIPVLAEDDGALSAKEQAPEKKAATNGKGKDKKEPKAQKAKVSYAFYTVKKGESLGMIAERNGLPLATLLKLNDMKPKDPLYAGRKIKMPVKEVKAAKRYYRVKKGDTLESIARRHKTTIAALKQANGTKKLSPLYVEQKLEIPRRE